MAQKTKRVRRVKGDTKRDTPAAVKAPSRLLKNGVERAMFCLVASFCQS
jgi:hypothetical protein